MKKNIVIAILTLIVLTETVYIAGFSRPKFRKRPHAVQKLTPEEAAVRKDSNKLVKSGFKKIKQKDLNGAFADCTKAMQIDEKNSAAFRCRAYVRLKNNDEKGVISEFETALKVNPNDKVSKVMLKKIKTKNNG